MSVKNPPATAHDRKRAADAASGGGWGPPGARRLQGVNWLGVWTLYRREVLRFLKVYGQTLAAPIATAGLFLLVFTLAFGADRGEVMGLTFAAFLAPGVVMMTVVQNAFANTSSSVIIAKIQGNIVDTLMPPLSAAEVTFALTMGGATRGVLVGLVSMTALFPFVGVGVAEPFWLIFFVVVGSTMLALLGVIAGIWSQKFDQMAAITNFVVTPLSFLSGTFYSVERLPEPWATISHWNPIFYLIDGFRRGATGVSDSSPYLGAAVCLIVTAAIWWACWRLIETGYRLKS